MSGPELPQGAAQFLASLPLEQLLASRQQQNVLALEHNQTIGEALRALAKRKVLSAPLVVAPALEDLSCGDPPSGPALLGWVDVADVLRGLIAHLREKHTQLPSSMLLLMSELETEGKIFARKPLITLTGSSDRRLMYTLESGTPLLQTIREQFLGGASNGQVAHRLAVFDSDGTITNIVSQLDVVRHLCAHAEQLLGPLAHRPLSQLPLQFTRAPLVAVDPSVPTLLAFDHMLKQGVSGAPVLTQEGVMVANLSVSDLRCIQPEHLGVLALPVAEFLALLHRTTYLGYSQGASASKNHEFFAGSPRPRTQVSANEFSPQAGHSMGPPRSPRSPMGAAAPVGLGTDEDVRLISVKPDSPLLEVLHMLGDNHIHRVYIVDPSAPASARLQGVITPTDILCWVAGMPAPKVATAPRKTYSGPLPVAALPQVKCT